MTDINKPIAAVMEEAANILLCDLHDTKATIGEKTKAFEVLTAYYVASFKENGKSPAGGKSFAEMRDRIRAVGTDDEPSAAVSQ